MKSYPSNLAGLRLLRCLALAGAVCAAAALAGCYVVPLNAPPQRVPVPVAAVQVVPLPANMTFTARLYPANDMASAYGMVGAVVTNDLNGHGTFSTVINGESFSGEATRAPGGSSREGIANGTGSRGSYINCRYQMNSSTMGSGQCRLSNGAQFTMHVGS